MHSKLNIEDIYFSMKPRNGHQWKIEIWPSLWEHTNHELSQISLFTKSVCFVRFWMKWKWKIWEFRPCFLQAVALQGMEEGGSPFLGDLPSFLMAAAPWWKQNGREGKILQKSLKVKPNWMKSKSQVNLEWKIWRSVAGTITRCLAHESWTGDICDEIRFVACFMHKSYKAKI